MGIKPVSVETTDHHYLVELRTPDDVRNLNPDFSKINRLEKFGTIITAKSDDTNYDFISRYFVPAKGINEDPVTGSTHCILAPYWSKKLGKKTMNAFQASQRGGELKLTMEGDRVLISGTAVTILAGELLI